MEEKKCQANEGVSCIPFFAHENTVVHMNNCNRRMLVALLAVCITFILTIIIFVSGYTQREKNWLETISAMQHAEDSNGVYEHSDP